DALTPLVRRFERGTNSELLGEGETGGQRFDPCCAIWLGKRRRRDAYRGQHAARQLPAFVQPEYHPGGKGISGPRSASNLLRRNPQRRLPDILTFACPREGTFREMNDHKLTDTHLEQGACSVT